MDDMISLTQEYPAYCFPLAGLHPSSVEEDYHNELSVIKTLLDSRKFWGIGEIGLDYYWDRTFEKEQIEALKIQLGWALELNLPAIIHNRESFDDTIKIVEEVGAGQLKGIFHCFTGTIEQAEKIIELGFSLGIGGILTFKNSGLDQTLKNIPLEHLILETDSPYLAPVPKRGKRNEPAFLPYIANKLAEIKDLDINQIAEQTSHNAEQIFDI
jgi:TatD DNase family protein